jgi:hypothetical protein
MMIMVNIETVHDPDMPCRIRLPRTNRAGNKRRVGAPTADQNPLVAITILGDLDLHLALANVPQRVRNEEDECR